MKENLYCGICGQFVGVKDHGGFWVYKRGDGKRWYHWRCYENEQKEIRRIRDENRGYIKR